MIAVVRRLLREERLRLAIITIAMAAWFVLIMAVARAAAADLQAQVEFFDSPLTRGFGLGAITDPDTMLAQLVGVSFNHPIPLALVGAVTIALGARACQGELRAGTLEPTLARALPRRSYLAAYMFVIVLMLAAVMSAAWVAVVGADRLLQVPGELDAGRAAMLALNSGIAFLGFGAIALLLSVLLGPRGSAAFATVGILVVMFAITFAERAWDAALLDVLGPLSLFHWYDPAPTLLGAGVPARNLLVPIGVSVACALLSLWRFERRDL